MPSVWAEVCKGLSEGVVWKVPASGSSEQLTHQTHPCPLPHFTRRPGKSPVQSPRWKGRILVARNQALELWRLWGHLHSTFQGPGRGSWVPAHPPALANNLLFVKVYPTKLLEPKPHSLSWIAATPSMYILCLRVGLLSTSCTKMYDPWFSIIGVN